MQFERADSMGHWRNPYQAKSTLNWRGMVLVAVIAGVGGYFSIKPFFWFAAFVGKVLLARFQ